MLFKRKASLLIGQEGSGLLIEGLRLSFKIVKTIDAQKNTATIKVYNLSPESRGLLEEPETTLILKAGYEDQDEIIAYGDLYEFKTVKEKPDTYTELTIKDGGKAVDSTLAFESFGPGTTVDQVVSTLTDKLGLPIKELKTGISDQFANGFTVAGPIKDVLASLGESFGFDFSVQDGEIQTVDTDSTTGDELVLINEETGMINAPVKIVGDDVSADKTTVSRAKVTSLLNPKLRPGVPIELSSEDVYGIYKVEKVTHVGDTRGGDWFSEIEVKLI